MYRFLHGPSSSQRHCVASVRPSQMVISQLGVVLLITMFQVAQGQTQTSISGWNQVGCFVNIGGSSYGSDGTSSPYTRSSCESIAINNRHRYWGLTNGGDVCQTNSGYSTSNAGTCDWTSHAGETSPSIDAYGGPDGRMSVYSTNFPACTGVGTPAHGSNPCGSSISDGGCCAQTCNTDYTNLGSSVCCDRTWLSGGASCYANCPAVAAPTGGSQGSCGPSTIGVGSSCSITCTLPYVKSGPSSVTCQTNSQLSGTQTCLAPCMGPPTTPGYGGVFGSPSPSVVTSGQYQVGTTMPFTCPSGTTPINSPVTCLATSQWSTGAFCLDLRMQPVLSTNLTTMSPYSGLVTWTNDMIKSSGLPSSAFTYRYLPALVFPVSTGPDALESPLSGVRFAAGGSWVSTSHSAFAQLTSDNNGEIEHARFSLQIEATYTDPTSNQVSVGSITTNSISLPCSCDQEGALTQTLIAPTDALMFGTPLNPTIQQTLDDSNALLFRFTPNSLCSDSYSISAVAGVGGALDENGKNVTFDILPVTVTQLHLENTQSCGFLTEQAETFVQVKYPMHGRPMLVCIQPLPRTICTTCTSSYGTLLSEGSTFQKMPETCVTFTPAFFVTISGKVTTPLSTFSKEVAPVPDVLITINIIDSDTKDIMQVPNPDGSNTTVPLAVSMVTDERGRYSLTLSSTALINKSYMVRVTPSKSDTDPISGSVVNHIFAVVNQESSSTYDDTMEHGQVLTSINFYDESEVGVAGSVLLPDSGATTPLPLQGCPVSGVLISAYLAADTLRLAPVRRTPVTGNDGQYLMSVPLYTKLVFIPTYQGLSIPTDGTPIPIHTFTPTSYSVDVRQSSIQLQPFYDTTQASFKGTFYGGACHYQIGLIRPVVRYLACGDSAHVELPSFGSAGKIWTLPAVEYQFALIDGSGLTGLQGADVGGYQLPDSYLYGPVSDWIASQPHVTVDLRSGKSDTDPNMVALDYKYLATPDITLVRPATCIDTAVQDPTAATYLYLAANSLNTIKFSLSATYGYIDTNGDDRHRICHQVETGVTVLDAVTATGAPLMSYYLGEDYGCTTGDVPCTMTADFNPNTTQTIATYILKTGDIERTENTDSNGNRFLPAYSRKIQYRLAGSVLDWQSINVVLLGSYSFPGSVSLIYPPYDAMFILRDPPGGGSTASLTQGTEVDTESSIDNSASWATSLDASMTFGGGESLTTCKGIGVEVCTMDIDTESSLTVGLSMSASGSTGYTSTEASSISMESTVTTSDSTLFANGDGDLFLTVSGTVQLRSAVTVDGKLVQDPDSSDPNAKVCQTTLRPTISWTKDPANSFVWSSQWDIQHVIIPSFQKTNAKILGQYGVTNVFDLKAQATADDFKKYQDNIIAINGWQGLLDYNNKLKDDSLPWPEFWQSMSASPSDPNSGHVQQMLDNAHASANSNGGQVDVAATDPKAAAGSGQDDGSATSFSSLSQSTRGFSLSNTAGIGSLSFFGGGSALSFSISTSSTQSSTRDVSFDMESSVTMQTSFDAKIFAVETGIDIAGSVTMGISQGSSNTKARTMTRTIDISLVDPDMGDMFQIEIRKDPVYGSPVYKILGGQSRCQIETGTLARDDMKLVLDQSSFEHVNPYSKISTVISLINNSPTGEDFAYTLSVPHETNLYGLRVGVNGVILGDAGIGITLTYNQALRLTVDIDRSNSAYTFEGIQFQLDGGGDQTPDGTPVCLQVTTNFNVYYDEPCNQIDFAGTLSSTPTFLVNQLAMSMSPDGTPLLAIVIRNNEASLPGRKWLDTAGTGFLQAIRMEYRSAPAGQVLSELDWSPILTVGSNGVPIDILKTISDTQAATNVDAGDFLSLIWDMSMLSDGPYQIRGSTKCQVPIGARDTSLYTHLTPIITGSLDIEPPRVFGTPVPSVHPFVPGQPIQVEFDQDIKCSSYFGKARVRGWINAGLTQGDRSDGLQLSLSYICRANILSVSFNYPLWTELVNRLVTIQVDRVRDVGGNEIENPITWSFYVDNFETHTSPVRVTGLTLTNSSLASLTTQYGSIAQVQLELSQEIADLVNLAIDTIQHPSPPAAASSSGLQRGGVIVSSVTSYGTGIRFNADLVPLPIFPGEPKPIYAPADYAHFLGTALQPLNLTAAAMNDTNILVMSDSTDSTSVSTNTTDLASAVEATRLAAQISTLYSNADIFPLLSHLVSNSELSFELKLLPDANQQAARSAMIGHRKRSVTDHTVRKSQLHHTTPTQTQTRVSMNTFSTGNVFGFTAQSTYDTTSASSTIVLQWQAGADAAQVLDTSNIQLTYIETASEADPNQPTTASTTTASTTAIAVDVTDTTKCAFTSQVLTNSSDSSSSKAIYQLLLFAFASPPGGRSLAFEVTVGNSTTRDITVGYSVHGDLFVVSSPTTPLVRSVAQTSITQFEVRLNPVFNNGLAPSAGDLNIAYGVTLYSSTDSTVSINVPSSNIALSRIDILDVTIVRLVVTVSNMTGLGFPLPSAGASVSWGVKVKASSSLAYSYSSSQTVTMQATPATVNIIQVDQTALNAFTILFSLGGSSAISTVIPSSTMILSYSYALDDVNNTQVSSTSTLTFSTDVTSVIDAASPTYSCSLVLPSTVRSSLLASLSVGLQSEGTWGLSTLQWYNVSSTSLIFLSQPTSFQVQVFDSTYDNTTSPPTQIVQLSWNAPTYANPSFSVIQRYRLSLHVADGLLLSQSPINSVDVLVETGLQNTNLTVPLIASPLDIMITYTFEISAVTVGNIFSEPAQVVLLADHQRFLNSTASQTPAVLQQQQAGIKKARMGATKQSMITTQLSQSTISTDGTLYPPVTLDAWQLSTTRLLVRFPITSHGATPTKYIITWSDGAPSADATTAPMVLGELDVDPLLAINGFITVHLDDASFDVPVPGQGPTDHTFFLSVYSIGSTGQSAATSKYINVLSSSAISGTSPPASLDVWQLSTTRLRVKFPLSPITGETVLSYVLSWTDGESGATSNGSTINDPIILGTTTVAPSNAIDGLITVNIDDPEFDVPIPGQPSSPHAFLISVHAVTASGPSARTTTTFNVLSSSAITGTMPPADLQVVQLTPTRARVTFPVSVGGEQPTSYILSWVDQAPVNASYLSMIIGSREVSPSLAINGYITVIVDDTQFDTLPQLDEDPLTPHPFQLRVHAMTSVGSSAVTTRTFMMARSLPGPDSWPSWYSKLSIVQVVLEAFLVLSVLAFIVFRLFLYRRQTKSAKSSAGLAGVMPMPNKSIEMMESPKSDNKNVPLRHRQPVESDSTVITMPDSNSMDVTAGKNPQVQIPPPHTIRFHHTEGIQTDLTDGEE